MKHIKDIYPMVKQVRRRIVETMQERGITKITLVPELDEWLEQNPDKCEEDYDYFRFENAPRVIYFTKYNTGYEYEVLSVELFGKNIYGFPRFRMDCYSGEAGGETFYDDDVYDMTSVYEVLEKRLGIDGEPEAIWVLFAESLYDYEIIGRHIAVFKEEDKARKMFKRYADDSRKRAKELEWEINDNDDFFESYPEGSWGTSHETVELNKTVLNETVICRP